MKIWGASQFQIPKPYLPSYQKQTISFYDATFSRGHNDSLKGRRVSSVSMKICSSLTYNLRDGDFDVGPVGVVKMSDGFHTADDD